MESCKIVPHSTCGTRSRKTSHRPHCKSRANERSSFPSIKWIFRVSLLLLIFIASTTLFSRANLEEEEGGGIYNGGNYHSRLLKSTQNTTNPCLTEEDSSNKPPWEKCDWECENAKVLWIIVYAMLILILFIGLAIICDEFFVPSLEVISEQLQLSEDVAGATFMAAGSSAPELFTSIMGVSIDSDVGVGTIVGSAVFNILIIIALTSVLAGQVLVLDWRPLIRDSICYGISIICFIIFVWDGELRHYECIILLVLYILYIVLMKFNSFIMEKLCFRSKVAPSDGDPEQCDSQSKLAAEPENPDDGDLIRPPRMLPPIGEQGQRKESISAQSLTASKHIFHHGKRGEFSSHFAHRKQSIMVHLQQGEHQNHAMLQPVTEKKSDSNGTVTSGIVSDPVEEITEKELEEEKTICNCCCCPIQMYYPNTDLLSKTCGCFQYGLKWIFFFISFPFMVMFTYTIPNCSVKTFRKWYVLSFIMSIVWIAILSFVMVMMVAKTGCLLGIDDYTMGLVVIAIGTSVPDALSSILVARDGYGDMAVSNALGSNVFDINLGLGLPFLIRILFFNQFQPVNLLSTEVVEAGYTITPHAKFGFILLFILFMTLIVFTCVRFRLNIVVGISFVLMYIAFLIYAFLAEVLCESSTKC